MRIHRDLYANRQTRQYSPYNKNCVPHTASRMDDLVRGEVRRLRGKVLENARWMAETSSPTAQTRSGWTGSGITAISRAAMRA